MNVHTLTQCAYFYGASTPKISSRKSADAVERSSWGMARVFFLFGFLAAALPFPGYAQEKETIAATVRWYATGSGCLPPDTYYPGPGFPSASAAIAAFPSCNTFCGQWNGGSTNVNPDMYYVSITTWSSCNNVDMRSDPSTYDSGTVFADPVCPEEYTFERGPDGYVTTGNCWINLVHIERAKKPCDHCTGDSITPGTGNKRQEETDYIGAGFNPLTFKRIYNSASQFGQDWKTNYSRSISISAMGISATLHRPDGDYSFSQSGGAWVPDSDVNYRLTGGYGWFTVTTPDGRELEHYDGNNQLSNVQTAGGAVKYALTYDSTDPTLLVQVSDDFGHALNLTYNGQGRLATMTDPNGGQYQYGYDGNGNLTSVTYPDTKVRQYVYNESAYTASTSQPHALTGIVDENNARFANFGYNAAGLAVLTEHAGGVDHYAVSYTSPPAVINSSYVDAGIKYLTTLYQAPTGTAVTDALGVTRHYGFSEINGGIKTTSNDKPCKGLCTPIPQAQSFDANGNVSSKTDFNGNVTNYVFDLPRNLETSRTEAYGTGRARTITTSWDSTFRLPALITELNRTTAYTYDADGNVLTRTITDTGVIPNVVRTWTYTYDSYGQVLTADGPRTDVSDVTTYTYYSCSTGSECGQLNIITNALSQATTYDSYNAHGQPTQITDANGLVTAMAYDARKRLTDRCVGSTLPGCTGGELTHLDYWPTGLLKKVTNPDASFIQYTYDNAHRLTQINDGASNKVVYTLDAMGNRTAENTYDPSLVLKRTHTRVFNTLNQLWKDVNAAGTVNVTTVFGYDTNGNQTTTNAPLSRNSTSLYDELNRLKQITDPNSGITQFGYDANDNLTSVTDPRTLATTYTYTGFGDLKTQTSPDTGLTTNTYDSGGNLKTSTDARNAITTYSYDALNRVSTAAYKIGATTDQTITYTYDAGTNGKGHLTGASDANHTLAWTYDAKGRVTAKGQTLDSITKSVGYGYNAFGQLASIVLPSGQTITYGYNANNQVTSVTLNGSPNVTILNSITYDPFGPITGWSWGNSTTASRTFDTDGKLTQVTSSGQRTFGYDDAFRITAANNIADATKSWTLGYDILDRLNSATKTGTTIGYTYDADGNRLTQTGTSASTYTISGTSNKLSSTTGALVRTYGYDAVGNVLNSSATTHSYNNAGRMKTGKLGAASATTYVYNALGQRVKKSGGAIPSAIYFMYDEAGHLIGEYNSTGGLVQETVWLGDIPVATLRPKTPSGVDVFYVHTDQLNTPRKVTSNAASPVLRWQWDPTPFGEGNPTETPGGQPAFKYNLRFPGQYFDLETNLNYNYFRDYDPAVGRYVESDPLGLKGGWSTYAYVGGDPISCRPIWDAEIWDRQTQIAEQSELAPLWCIPLAR